MSTVIAHPTGNEFFRAAARGLYDAGKLQSIYTCIAAFPGTWLYNAGRLNAFRDIRRRVLPAAFQPLTHRHPWKETARLLSIKTNREKWLAHETGIFSTDSVYRSFDNHVASKLALENRKGAAAIYAYEDGAVHAFANAKALGMKTIYDLPIGYWRSMHGLLAEEKELNPAWAGTLEGLKDSAAKLARKEEEIALADAIIVASSFTAQSLETYPQTLPPVHIIPYGFPPVCEKNYRHIAPNDTIKLLFVGGLSQRKGLSYLFKAIEGLGKKIRLTIVGRGVQGNTGLLKENLANHTWMESLPHPEVLALMREQDILIFPSLFEGFGQVITEAMAQGTPVITTERTAGPDLIEHGKNGWLVKAGSAEALKQILDEILASPAIIEPVGKAALETARLRPWTVYGSELATLI